MDKRQAARGSIILKSAHNPRGVVDGKPVGRMPEKARIAARDAIRKALVR